MIPALRIEYRRVRELEARLNSLKGLLASVYMRREGGSTERTGM